jgi:hypothetical protein
MYQPRQEKAFRLPPKNKPFTTILDKKLAAVKTAETRAKGRTKQYTANLLSGRIVAIIANKITILTATRTNQTIAAPSRIEQGDTKALGVAQEKVVTRSKSKVFV